MEFKPFAELRDAELVVLAAKLLEHVEAVQDIEANTRKLRALKEMGVNIAIDDFGTGNSSFETLRQRAVDRVKVDAVFVGGLLSNQAVTCSACSLD